MTERHWSSGGVFADPRMREALDALVAMQESGAKKAECDAYLKSQFPQSESDRRDRYFCKTCRDPDGFVRVWSQRAMKACLNNKIDDRKNRTTCLVPCECDRGRSKVGQVVQGKPKPPFVRHFDPNLDCLCRDPESEESIQDLKDWCEAKLNEKPANYVHGFDDYNNQHEEPFV